MPKQIQFLNFSDISKQLLKSKKLGTVWRHDWRLTIVKANKIRWFTCHICLTATESAVFTILRRSKDIKNVLYSSLLSQQNVLLLVKDLLICLAKRDPRLHSSWSHSSRAQLQKDLQPQKSFSLKTYVCQNKFVFFHEINIWVMGDGMHNEEPIIA